MERGRGCGVQREEGVKGVGSECSEGHEAVEMGKKQFAQGRRPPPRRPRVWKRQSGQTGKYIVNYIRPSRLEKKP